MIRKDALPELLSPAGDFSAMLAAVAGGADAVYLGGKSFGARAFAKNFEADEISRAVEYCHLHGVKLYVTVNTLVYDRELPELSDYLRVLYEIGVDAVITADLGVIREARRCVPKLEIHASTQMSVHNTIGADAAALLGCNRVVLARELSLADIKSVTEKSACEVEIFLHGALCVCHSGQCLMSSLVGGRSGNRGECAQPCRLPYNGKYPLSLSDLALAAHVPELIESGVASLKIEGRMKSPEYVYTVTSIYRRLLDERRGATAAEMSSLSDAFSRGEFTDGYFVGKKDSRMTGVRSQSDKDRTTGAPKMIFEPQKRPIRAEATIRLGESSCLTFVLPADSRTPEKRVTVYGDAPSVAINSPLQENDVKTRLSKLGQTLFTLSPCDIKLELDEGVNLSPAAINSLRRSVAEALINTRRTPSDAPIFNGQKHKNGFSESLICTALFLSGDLFSNVIDDCPKALSDVDVLFLPITSYREEANGIYLPPVIFDSELDGVERLILNACKKGAKYALVGNIGHITLARKYSLIPIGDFRLNITNSLSREAYFEMGVERAILSPEITLPMARDIGGGEIVYGKIPLMLTERCFIKENFGCDKCTSAALCDRTGAKFALMREYPHRNLVINSRPTYMGDRKEELSSAGINHIHFLFTNEKIHEVIAVMKAYKTGMPIGGEVRRIGARRTKTTR